MNSTTIRSSPHMPSSSLKPRPKPLLRAGSVRSREEADMDMGLPPRLASPPKRPRVAFNDTPQVYYMEQNWEKSVELIREEVRQGLEKHKLGDDDVYDKIVRVFKTAVDAEDAPSENTLKNYLMVLMGRVSQLDRKSRDLVNAILEFGWIGRDEALVSLYIRFLGNLVSSQGIWVPLVLRGLVERLSGCLGAIGRIPSSPTMRRAMIFGRIHKALRYLLQLIPYASTVLVSVLQDTFPPTSDSKRRHLDYVQNLLRIIAYSPELKNDILALITDKLVKIDAQVQADLEDVEEETGEFLINGTAKTDDEEDYESDLESLSSDESSDADEGTKRAKELKSNVEKMDAILDTLFGYYAPAFSSPTSMESQKAFKLLLSQFDSIILPTYKSRHAQFLLFHFAQTSLFFIEDFNTACMKIAQDTRKTAVLRQSAVAYLSSFVARGANVPPNVVRDVVKVIEYQLGVISRAEEITCRGPNLKKYGVYYSLVQALMYIFCFRWKDLVSSPQIFLADEGDQDFFDGLEITWTPGIKDTLTKHLLHSKFNPLKICSPSIVNEFARIARHLGFMYVYSKIETNKRLRWSSLISIHASANALNHPIRETALSARKDESWLQLEPYFPFDPYQLPRSKRWVKGDYVEWRGIPGLDPLEGDDSDSEEKGLVDVEVEEGTETESEGNEHFDA